MKGSEERSRRAVSFPGYVRKGTTAIRIGKAGESGGENTLPDFQSGNRRTSNVSPEYAEPSLKIRSRICPCSIGGDSQPGFGLEPG